MLEKILSGNELNFNQLEKEFFKIGCDYASELLKRVLEQADNEIAKSRDRQKYRHKGKRKTLLKTLMGEVEYERTIYETKNDAGEKAYVYLLDEMMKLETVGKISTNLAYKIAENACISSYRHSAKNISDLTGQCISHGGVWQVVQALGSKIKEEEDKQAELATRDKLVGKKETKVLFEEADGVWLSMQGKDRPRRGRKLEMKVAVAYDGWQEQSAGRYELHNKVAVIGMETSSTFQKRKEGMIAAHFNRDEIVVRILNGDGARWIKAGMIDESVHYQLDPFHLNREILRNVKDKKQRNTIIRLLCGKKIDNLLQYVSAIKEMTTDDDEKKKLQTLYSYLSNNKTGLIPYKERGLDIPKAPRGIVYRQLGTMEHHICDMVTHRMKHRKASWSVRGAENLGKLLTHKVCGSLFEKISNLSTIVLPERYKEEISQVISASKAPIKDGKGYRYPVIGSIPFDGVSVTGGRKAIQKMVKLRGVSSLVYR